MKKVISILLLVITSAAYAQPTLTAATSTPIIGNVYYTYYCYLSSSSISTGATGAGITWDYSSLVDSVADTISTLACSSTPYFDSFPGSTFVNYTSALQAYEYDSSSTTEWAMIGAYWPVSTGGPGSVYCSKAPANLRYPLTYGDTWQDTSIYSVPSNYQHTFTANTNTADGYGTLITPSATYTNVLRVHFISYTSDTQYNTGSPEVEFDREENYYWYQPGTHYPVMYMCTFTDSATGALLYIQKVVFNTPIPYTKVNFVSNPSGADYKIFPNPATDKCTITSPVQFANDALAKVYDMSGRLVAAYSLSGSSIEISLEGLASGIYQCQINSVNDIVYKKLVVMR